MKGLAHNTQPRGAFQVLPRVWRSPSRLLKPETLKEEYRTAAWRLKVVLDLPIAIVCSGCFRLETGGNRKLFGNVYDDLPKFAARFVRGEKAKSKASLLKSIALVSHKSTRTKRFSYAKLLYRVSISNNQRQNKMEKCAACAENPEFLKQRDNNLTQTFRILNFLQKRYEFTEEANIIKHYILDALLASSSKSQSETFIFDCH